eukprot:gnl/MRDRNA2_/MRDRNA2_131749_c0_seq1.p1 gnl/MRDRNA2_/MRDRNA2_131749_c0~~gnl/MRDRNA2_/MRDRNA2_131749_c0_seq1.p1  ORF type:complete len:365 (+),score=49.14 gnl/MRDRNA2_/MRDRNA2_131749_c0_seq1:84-1097(+)
MEELLSKRQRTFWQWVTSPCKRQRTINYDKVGNEQSAEESAEDGLEPSEEELQSLSGVLSRLWNVDAPYRLEAGQHYRLHPQARAASLSSQIDRCRCPLFEFIDEEKLRGFPCADAFISLLDNYEADTADEEVVTNQERREIDQFLEKLMQTPHMKYAHKVLVAWNAVNPDYQCFTAKVLDIWFSLYSVTGRWGPKSSSGFEHVFVGENKVDREGRKSVIGFHNWIRFWRQECLGNVDYRGYIGARQQADDRVVSVRFAWDDDADSESETKSVSTFLVGTSVAFEFAMFTISFLGYKGNCGQEGVMLGEEVGPVKVTTYPWTTALGTVVRSAFIEAK